MLPGSAHTKAAGAPTASAQPPTTLERALPPPDPPTMPLQYKLWQPKPIAAPRPPPLLLLLHGSGADENDLLGLAPQLSAACDGAVVASLRGPIAQMGGFAWFHGNSGSPTQKVIVDLQQDFTDSVLHPSGLIGSRAAGSQPIGSHPPPGARRRDWRLG